MMWHDHAVQKNLRADEAIDKESKPHSGRYAWGDTPRGAKNYIYNADGSRMEFEIGADAYGRPTIWML